MRLSEFLGVRAVLFHLAVTEEIEREQFPRSMPRIDRLGLLLTYHTGSNHFLAEVAAVERHTENTLVEPLELWHREVLCQHFESYRLVVNVPFESLLGLLKDIVMVEGQWWQAVNAEPSGVNSIIAAFDRLFPDEGIEGNGYHSATRVAVNG